MARDPVRFPGNTPYTFKQWKIIFWSKVDKRGENECWEWTGKKTKKGYGFFYHGLPCRHAHRFSLRLKLGRKLCKGEHALHDCPGGDNPACVNPAHLWLGSNLDNIQDKMRKGRGRGWKNPNSLKGENHPRAKLTNTDIPVIRKRIKRGDRTDLIAADYGVSRQIISMIKHGTIWKSVP